MKKDLSQTDILKTYIDQIFRKKLIILTIDNGEFPS